MWGMVAQWLEHGTLSRENPGSNPLATVSKVGQFRCLSSFSCINEYLAIDSGGYVN